jgi:hypothetical protein
MYAQRDTPQKNSIKAQSLNRVYTFTFSWLEIFREYMLTCQTINMQSTPKMKKLLEEYKEIKQEAKGKAVYNMFAYIKAKKYKYSSQS